MLSLAEAARLREDGSYDHYDEGRAFPASPQIDIGGKRGRGDTRDSLLLRAAPQQRGSHAGFKDPIELGWCTAAQGERLFNV